MLIPSPLFSWLAQFDRGPGQVAHGGEQQLVHAADRGVAQPRHFGAGKDVQRAARVDARVLHVQRCGCGIAHVGLSNVGTGADSTLEPVGSGA